VRARRAILYVWVTGRQVGFGYPVWHLSSSSWVICGSCCGAGASGHAETDDCDWQGGTKQRPLPIHEIFGDRRSPSQDIPRVTDLEYLLPSGLRLLLSLRQIACHLRVLVRSSVSEPGWPVWHQDTSGHAYLSVRAATNAVGRRNVVTLLPPLVSTIRTQAPIQSRDSITSGEQDCEKCQSARS